MIYCPLYWAISTCLVTMHSQKYGVQKVIALYIGLLPQMNKENKKEISIYVIALYIGLLPQTL